MSTRREPKQPKPLKQPTPACSEKKKASPTKDAGEGSNTMLYYNIVTAERASGKRKIKARDYVPYGDSSEEDEDKKAANSADEEFVPDPETVKDASSDCDDEDSDFSG